MSDTDIIVIGGGPAGIMAAGFAARQGARVTLLEKNRRCGAKLLLTGKGRCNVTNSETDPRRFASYFGQQGKALLTALYAFDIEQSLAFFEQHGLPLQHERGGRVFPAQGDASAVQRVLDQFLKETGVTLINNCTVTDIGLNQGRITALETAQGRFSAERYIIATGGLSYPETGCTGDGYRWARQSGHQLINPQPALVPILLKEDWTDRLSHFNLKNVSVEVRQQDKRLAQRFGEAFFTRDGIGGPIVLDLSSEVRSALKKGPVSLILDLKPAVSNELFDKRLQREFKENANRDFKNSLDKLLPKDMIPLFIELSGIPPELKCHSLSRQQRNRLLQLFKQLELQVSGLGDFSKAIITAGGVSLGDIDMRCMRSKKISNLFFAGEMIDLDAPTGGYNLQLCWSTGYLAGTSAAASLGNA